MVAVGQHGMAWVAWSQGPDADACQDVGSGDRIEIAVSHDGGRTFGTPVAMPRRRPLRIRCPARAAARRTGGDLLDRDDEDGRPGSPRLSSRRQRTPTATGTCDDWRRTAAGPARCRLLRLSRRGHRRAPDGKLIVAAPFWVSGRNVIRLAVGTPGGRWQETSLSEPAGADLLLPALGLLSPGDVRLLCAVHTRLGDRLGYDWADVTVTGQGPNGTSAGLTALTPAPSGPGFFEIGEELALSRTQGGLLTAVVVAGHAGAALETAMFSAPLQATTPAGQSGPARVHVQNAPARNAGGIRHAQHQRRPHRRRRDNHRRCHLLHNAAQQKPTERAPRRAA